MKLLTPEIAAKLPPIYANEHKAPSEIKVVAKFFNPCGRGTWYATEYDPDERMFFGYCHLFEGELGYFSLDELESVKLPFGLGIERDVLWNENTTLQTVMDRGH
jgi:hypothetical protein